MSTTTTETRSLGAGGRQLAAVGVGTWALGGPYTFDGRDAGWGEVDDAESIRALVRQVAVLPPVKSTLRHNGAAHARGWFPSLQLSGV